jgi:hypothetical protein
MSTRLHNYAEVRAYLEKEHPDWIRALTPRHINAPADYWPLKVLAVSSAMPRCVDLSYRRHNGARPLNRKMTSSSRYVQFAALLE